MFREKTEIHGQISKKVCFCSNNPRFVRSFSVTKIRSLLLFSSDHLLILQWCTTSSYQESKCFDFRTRFMIKKYRYFDVYMHSGCDCERKVRNFSQSLDWKEVGQQRSGRIWFAFGVQSVSSGLCCLEEKKNPSHGEKWCHTWRVNIQHRESQPASSGAALLTLLQKKSMGDLESINASYEIKFRTRQR